MAPVVEGFPAWELEARIPFATDGKRRKDMTDLKDCQLKQMVQHRCELLGPREDRASKVGCEPILRLFRRYVQLDDLFAIEPSIKLAARYQNHVEPSD